MQLGLSLLQTSVFLQTTLAETTDILKVVQGPANQPSSSANVTKKKFVTGGEAVQEVQETGGDR